MHATLAPSELRLGLRIDLPSFSLSEQEIIDFAVANDPQPIHIDKAFAKNSYFKDLIACGAHIYVKTHKEQWIRLTERSFICGLEINNWKFFKPVYANQAIHPQLSIIDLKANSDGKTAAITWQFHFYNEEKELYQSLDVKVMHRIA